MTKQPYNVSGLLTRELKVTSSEALLPDVAGHDEWLLDEALAETLPANDSIAVSPHSPASDKPPSRPGNQMTIGNISDCNIGNGKDPWINTLGTPIECDHCRTKIPATVALSFEGADYIYHFCGPQCIEVWCKATNAHDK